MKQIAAIGIAALAGVVIGWITGTGVQRSQGDSTVGHAQRGSEMKMDRLRGSAEPVSIEQVLTWMENRSYAEGRARMFAYVSTLDLAGILTALEQSKKNAHDLDDGFTRALCERWAELDAEGLLQESLSSTDVRLRQHGISAAFSHLARNDAESIWSRAEKLNPLFRKHAFSGILSYLEIESPERALELINRSESPDVWSIVRVTSAWAGKDPRGAMAAAANLQNAEHRDRAFQSIVEKWATMDVNAALLWSKSLENAGERERMTGIVLSRLAREDPQAAARLLESETGRYRGVVLSKIVSTMALHDFDGALEFALDRKSFAERRRALIAVSQNPTDEQAAQLMEIAKTLPPSLAKSIYESGIWNLANEDPERLVQWIEQIPQASVRETALKRSVNNLKWSSPEQAARLFAQLQPGSQTTKMASDIAGNLASSDPKRGAEWAAMLEIAAHRKAALSTVAQSWAAREPAGARQLLAEIEEPDIRQEVARSIADGLSGRSIREAEEFATSLEGSDRSAALASVVSSAAARDPQRAPELYERFADSLSAEEAAQSQYREIASKIAVEVAQTDPGKAVAWVNGLSEGPARDEAMGGIAATWAAFDSVATSEWLYEQPKGPGRDIAAERLVTTISGDDPESAWAWAVAIDAPDRRRNAAARVIESWKANGLKGKAAAALAEAAIFSEADLAELAKKLD